MKSRVGANKTFCFVLFFTICSRSCSRMNSFDVLLFSFFTTLHLLLTTNCPQIKSKHTHTRPHKKSKPQSNLVTPITGRKCQGSDTRKVANTLPICCAWVSQINSCTLGVKIYVYVHVCTGYWQQKGEQTAAWVETVREPYTGCLMHLIF